MSLFAPWSSDKVASGDAPTFTNDTKDISAEMSKMHIDANDSMVSTSELLEPLGTAAVYMHYFITLLCLPL
jgi:hypothetical protein